MTKIPRIEALSKNSDQVTTHVNYVYPAWQIIGFDHFTELI